MLTHKQQRWRERESRWAPHHTLFDPTLHEVVEIGERTAKDFVKTHHYSGTYPAARFRAGLYKGDQLMGVAVFSVPCNQRTLMRYVDLENPNQGVELGRLVLLDEAAYNAETWFLSRAFKLMRKAIGARFCLSFSDPVERYTSEGNLVKPGHIGQIYQALNASFYGRASKATMLLLPDGRVINPRTLGKVRREESGIDYAVKQLVQGGAPPPELEESGAAYVERITPLFKKLRHPGNLSYGWCFDKHLKEHLNTLPYLKMADLNPLFA